MDLKRPITPLEWNLTPEPARRYILHLEQSMNHLQQQVRGHEKRIERLEVRAGKNSQNSSKPPSSDSPFDRGRRKKKTKKSKRTKGGQKGHKGHSQQMLEPTKRID